MTCFQFRLDPTALVNPLAAPPISHYYLDFFRFSLFAVLLWDPLSSTLARLVGAWVHKYYFFFFFFFTHIPGNVDVAQHSGTLDTRHTLIINK